MLLLAFGCNELASHDALDGSVRPAPPIPEVTMAPPAAGALLTVWVDGAEPGAEVTLMGALGEPGDGSCPAVLDGLCVGLADPFEVAGKRVADDVGGVVFSVRVPSGRLAGDAMVWQAAAVGSSGAALSEVVATVVVDPVAPGVAGAWLDAWGTRHHVNALLWEDGWGNRFWISDVDGSALVARNDRANAFAAHAWSRFDWFEADGLLWYCQAAWDADSPDAAWAEPASDPSDPMGGCDGFGWTSMAQESAAVVGTWVDGWGTAHTVTDGLWTDSFGNAFHIDDTSVLDSYLVAQNDAANAFFPSLWSRFDWTTSVDGDLWYCQTAYAEGSAQQARVARPADPTDLGAGCGGFGWTNLTP